MLDFETQWSKVTLAGAVVAGVGSLGPWATWEASDAVAALGDVPTEMTVWGYEGDGLVTLAIVLAVLGLLLVRDEERVDAIGSAVLGLAILGFGALKYSDLQSIITDIPAMLEGEVEIAAAWGLYLVILGGVVVLLGGLYGAFVDADEEAGPAPI